MGPTQVWTGGDADCTAQAGYWRVVGKVEFIVLGEDTFTVFDD